jgi:methionyl-tRNA formyltransferase
MRIVFISTVEFSFKALEKLINIDSNVVGVCTKEISYFNNDFKDLTSICKNNYIPIKYIEDINSNDSINWIKNCKPDIIFCFGWSNLIKEELLNLAPMGIVGFHPAYLPQNRGRHPLIWALVLGLKKVLQLSFLWTMELIVVIYYHKKNLIYYMKMMQIVCIKKL